MPSVATIPVLRSSALDVPRDLRVLVVAPHPDDETLAAGGLIQRVQSRHGTVHVVFVTNGDGYVDGVRRHVNRDATSSIDFIRYGHRRRAEAREALARLGVDEGHITFLGFPDDGIDDLWGHHWSDQHPYTSPHTRLDHPYDPSARARGIEYAGTDLERELQRILEVLDPHWVIIPDPRDRHPDHCTTGVFVLDALRRRREQNPGAGSPRTFTYLVHAPDYPASPTWVHAMEAVGVGGSTTAREVFAASSWFNLVLGDAESHRKQGALDRYESQAQVMSPFLKQFLRGYELFSEINAQQTDAIARAYAARFGRHR